MLMFLFKLIANLILYMVITGIDVVAFFLVIRAVADRWPLRSLVAMDRVGDPISTPLIAAVVRRIPYRWVLFQSRRTQLAAAGTLLALAFVRLLLVSLFA